MKASVFFILLTLFCSFSSEAKYHAAEDGPTIRIQSGVLQGITEEGVDCYKGIPYAAPPIGEFRWRPPQPVTPWEGIREAKTFGPNCAQAGWGAAPGTIAEGSSEDCLYLNIWAPSGRKSNEKYL